jgi:electron transfer flavoprotein beta subunit
LYCHGDWCRPRVILWKLRNCSRWPEAAPLLVDKEQPGSVIWEKQAIDDDCNRDGQMLVAHSWLQATFALTEVADGVVNRHAVKSIGNPALAAGYRHHLRLNEPRYVTFKHHEEGKKAALTNISPEDLGRAASSRASTLKVSEPPKRSAGIKVAC